MIRQIFTATVATAAFALGAPALAGPGHGPGGGRPTGNAGTMGGSMGATHASPSSALNRGTINTTTTTNPAIGVSQGPNHASVNGIANANSHSVLAGGQVASTALPGLMTGLNVVNASGTTIGQVSQIVTDSSGNIRLVIVTDTTTGQTFRLAPNTLTISNGTVTTTSTVG